MLVKEYLSMTEAVNFVFELTGEKIHWSTLEELSNTDKLTPVFLFSGYVGYPDGEKIPYEKMKSYFTHDDFFMHQTRNYETYSLYGDADVPEWIEIHSPFKIQHIIKKQTEAYSVFDEVFLFKNSPITTVDKLENLKHSHIDFDEVRFSRNELIDLFNVKKPYENAQNEFEFYMGAAKTIRDSVTADMNARNDLIEPTGSQRLLISYALFTPHQITCLLSNDNPAYSHNYDKYNAYKDMISNAIEAKALNPINDKEQIPAEQVKLWLARYNFILKGFNDNLPNDTDKISQPTVTQTQPPNNEQLIKELAVAKAQIIDLEKKLSQAKAKLSEKPADEDKELNTKSQNYVAKIVLAIAQIAELDLDNPYAFKEPNTTNSIIFDQIKTNGMKVSNQVIGNWLKLANEQTKDD
ncbi:hypothetical protein [Psychrobacter aestuarii]|uniref:Uncharacterized protein n=1 Tax=Psychrobacter aestuarii TaxID=556327 RepID=A0ABP3FHM9_9GAMM|nr:hypothetical protein [Psychrobacter aestuarii]